MTQLPVLKEKLLTVIKQSSYIYKDSPLCLPSHPCRDKDYHLRTYKSVVMANKLIDWLIAQVSGIICNHT